MRSLSVRQRIILIYHDLQFTLTLGFKKMSNERTRSSLLSDTLDRRRALTFSPDLRGDSCHTESPLKIYRRRSTAEDEDTETSKDRKISKIHWTQLASNGTSPQSDPISQSTSDLERITRQDIQRRQVKVVLEDVLQTEIGQSLLKGRGQTVQLKNQSDRKRSARERRSDQTSTNELRDTRRTSVTLRSRTDSTEAKDTSPSQLTSFTMNESCSSSKQKKIKNSEVKQINCLKLSEPSEESSNSCSSRKSDSPQYVEISDQLTEIFELYTFKENEASSPEGSSQNYETVLFGLGAGHSPVSSLDEQCSFKEDEVGSEHLSSQREEDETVEFLNHAEEDEKENHKCRNGEVVQECEGLRGSVLRLSVGAEGEVPLKRCRLDSLSGEQDPGSDSTSGSTEGRSSQPPETIVLSSEEEEEEEKEEEIELTEKVEENSVLNIQPPGGVKDMHELEGLVSVFEQIDDSHITGLNTQSSILLELQLSSLHMGGVSAISNENMKITTEKITISLKDSSMKISISMANVHEYSLWEGSALKGCELLKDEENQPPSLLLLWLSDSQAHQLHKDLSVIQQGTHPAEGSTCVMLCLAESVAGIESTMLASLMDLVALTKAKPELSSPLTHPDCLKRLQSSQETHLLQLLTPKSTAHVTSSASAVKSQDSDSQPKPVYTLCHRRSKGSYSVSVEPVLESEWTPYRHQGPTRRLIQYPPPPSKGALTVTTEDLECLDSGEFLNDVIIDFYLKYLLVQKAPPASVERSHIFSSFFYKQLTRRDNATEDCTSTPAQVRRHQRVRTWTRHVDIFDKDFLFVPVNQEAHWYLVVICFPGLKETQHVKREGDGELSRSESLEMETEIQTDNKSNSDGDKDGDDSHKTASNSHDPPNCTESTCERQTVCKRPCILVMDSLKLSVHERIFKLLREYLQVEWEVKRGGYRDFSVEHMVGSHCKVPLQDNSSDCGLYLLQYAESFLQDPVIHFDLPLRLERWFPRQKVRGKREEIRDLVLHLYRFQQGSLGNEALIDRIDDRT